MRIVYATGSPRRLEFYLTDNRQSVPKGAVLFAICTKEQTIENQDEDLFDSITDEEYYLARRMVREAERLEKESRPMPVDASSIRRLFNWLSSLFSNRPGGDAGRRQPARKSSVSSRRRINSIQQGY